MGNLRQSLTIACIAAAITVFCIGDCAALSSTNISLDSPLYAYLDKLAGMGLIHSDIKGIKPYSKAEAARLLLEAEGNVKEHGDAPAFAVDLIERGRELLRREVSLKQDPAKEAPLFDVNPASSVLLRYVHLDGKPRSYERQVHDPGDDGVFGIGRGLRPANPYPTPAQLHGTEGTPLFENNDGIVYRKGNNGEVRWAAEGYVLDKMAALLEPSLLITGSDTVLRLNRGYLKVGGENLELEVGRDENWLGLGYRGAITLTNNARNLDLIKLSSPEPFRVGWLSWLGDLKYAFIFSRLDRTVVDGQERQPWFYALKLSMKPTGNLEIGLNLGRMQGGPGMDNSLDAWVKGLVGGTTSDNSKANAGFEARYRLPWLRNTELYGELSGCDVATFWPIVESYLAGIHIPMLTADGRNEFRFEYFRGNNILYWSDRFPEGFLYQNMTFGHSQGGAVEDYFFRYAHWFDARNSVALEYFFTERGSFGLLPGQAVERKNAGRVFWSVPVYGDFDAQLMYGVERIANADLVGDQDRTNQLAKFELRYRY